MMEYLMFAVGIGLLVFSSNMITMSLTKLSRFLRLSEFVTSFLLMAVATSIPELAIGVLSALQGSPHLSLGNAIGASLVNMTFVLGVISLIGREIKVDKIVASDILEMAGLVALLIALSFIGGGLSRMDGFILIGAFILYMVYMYFKGRGMKKRMPDHVSAPEAVIHAGLFLSMALLLFVSAEIVVKNAEAIGSNLGMGELLIGLVILSLGTTIPELFFESVSIVKRHTDMSLGNLVGSVVVNSCLVIGIVAAISPFKIEMPMFINSYGFLGVAGFLFFVFSESDRKITWKEGLVLLLLYVLFLITEMQLKGVI